MYHSKPAVTKAVMLAIGALCQAAAAQWPAYAPLLLTLSGAFGGGALVREPGTEKRGRVSVPPEAKP